MKINRIRVALGENDCCYRSQIELLKIAAPLQKMADRELTYLGASPAAVFGRKDQQCANFIEGEPELARTADEGKCPRFGRAVDPPPAGGLSCAPKASCR
jgi:hypothetical protein